MNPPVCVEAGAGGESLAADVTHVGPLPRVGPDVSLQQAGSVKLLATGVTRQHGLSPSDRNWSYFDLSIVSVLIPCEVRLRLRPDLTDGRQLGGAGALAVQGEERPGEVQGLGVPRHEGLQVAPDEGLPQHLDGGQEDDRRADGGRQVTHQLLARLAALDNLKHRVSAIIPPPHDVDIRTREEAGLQEPDPVAVTDQLARLLLDLIMEPKLMFDLKLAKKGEGGQEFGPDLSLQGVECVPLVQAPGPRHQAQVLAARTKHQMELRGTEYRCLHGI